MSGTDEHPADDHFELSRVSVVVLGAYVIVSAALLLYVREYAARHAAAPLLEFLVFPGFIVLVLILRRRRTEGRSDDVRDHRR